METKQGGSRPNSGRKPIEDKKVTVIIYPRQSRLKLIGYARIKQLTDEAIEKEYKRLLKIAKANPLNTPSGFLD